MQIVPVSGRLLHDRGSKVCSRVTNYRILHPTSLHQRAQDCNLFPMFPMRLESSRPNLLSLVLPRTTILRSRESWVFFGLVEMEKRPCQRPRTPQVCSYLWVQEGSESPKTAIHKLIGSRLLNFSVMHVFSFEVRTESVWHQGCRFIHQTTASKSKSGAVIKALRLQFSPFPFK